MKLVASNLHRHVEKVLKKGAKVNEKNNFPVVIHLVVSIMLWSAKCGG